MRPLKRPILLSICASAVLIGCTDTPSPVVVSIAPPTPYTQEDLVLEIDSPSIFGGKALDKTAENYTVVWLSLIHI